jgi:soluble P-type ATPase
VQASAEKLLKSNPEAVQALTNRWVGSGERYGRIG